MPSPLAAQRLTTRLVDAGGAASTVSIWSWGDLWKRVRRIKSEGPTLAPPAALRVLVAEALAIAGRQDELTDLAQPWYSGGFLARLSRTMERWTRLGIDEDSPLPNDPRGRTERRIFQAYRGLLARNGWQDAEGFALWASHAMGDPHVLAGLPLSNVFLVELPESRAGELAFAAIHEVAKTMTVVLTGDAGRSRSHFRPDPRTNLADRGFVEQLVPMRPACPAGLARVLTGFRSAEAALPSDDIDGLTVRGAPDPDGQILVVAREVRDRLDRGVPLDEIVVVTPHRDDFRVRIVEMLRAWGIPSSTDTPRTLATDPSIAALRLAIKLVVEGWEIDDLVALLRHNRVRPGWPELRSRQDLLITAKVVRESRVHRDATVLRASLFRRSQIDPSSVPAATALRVIDRLIALLTKHAKPGVWSGLVDGLFAIGAGLGLGESPAIRDLRSALDDQGEIVRRLGQDDEEWLWADFADNVLATIRGLEFPPVPNATPGIRVIGPESSPGLVVRHAILAGLGEGTFPSRSAVENAGAAPKSLDRAFADEKARFLAILAMAADDLTMVHPTTDEKGHPLLRASFLDDVSSLFTKEAWSRAHATIPRLGAILPPEFAQEPNEARVLAVAQSCLRSQNQALDRLLANRRHREALEGTAQAMLMTHWRSRRSRFDRYDGRLSDPRILARLATMIGTRERPFSASHLESMAACPFQFFQRYILRLSPSEEPEEIQEDAATRGSLLHDALETLHSRLRDMPDVAGRSLADRVEAGIGHTLDRVLESQAEPHSAIEQGLAIIEAERLRRLGRRYARQFRRYAEDDGKNAEGRHFELGFGRPENDYPPLQIGEAPRMIAVSGIIDRIDFLDRDGKPAFRVIDYKSGAAIPEADLQNGIALQLPLYAMAAERVIFASEGTSVRDFAYWSIRETGFKPLKKLTALLENPESWKAFTASLESYLMALVDRIQAGDLPLSPRKPDCRSHCDYQYICRISHTGAAGKPWPEQPTLEVPS